VLAEGAKNLAKVEKTILNQDAGADRNTKGKILEYAWKLKKRGLAPSTIKGRIYKLRQLAKKGANLMTPDTISTVLALSDWTESNKKAYISTYKSFAKTFNLSWNPPKTRAQRKLPFIPTEAEIDQLIAACGKKTAAFLQVLKDTGARSCEASKLKWIDVDKKNCTIRINNPAKGSLPRMIKVSSKTIAMINALPRTRDYIFNPNVHTTYTVFARTRNRIAKKLQTPRLKQIHFHTLRHWKATMEYHKTKDILHVKRLLGHKKLENTEIYTHLINFESDEWHVKTAKNLDEEKKLIEAGFQYVRYSNKDEIAIYRKRK
jgi:integrase